MALVHDHPVHPPVHGERKSETEKPLEDYLTFEPVSKYRNEVSFAGIQTSWRNFWQKFPRVIWNFYIEALLVPSYRREWGKYTSWNFHYKAKPKVSEPEKRKQTKINRRLKLLAKMRKMGGPGVAHNSRDCERVTFNVGGQKFQTQYRTLKQFPDTLLGDPERRVRYYDPRNNEYYFDRNSTSFQAVLYYFQSGGELYRPQTVRFKDFELELRFYGLSDSVIQNFREEEGILQDEEKPLPKNLLQRKIWLLVEYSESSKNARLVSLISIFVIILSIVVFCIETLPPFKSPDEETQLDITDTFFLSETICSIWFCLEILLRFFSSPSKLRFITNGMNLIDILAVVPYFANVFTIWASDNSVSVGDGRSRQATSLTVLRVVRLVRVFRIFKFSRHSKGLKILGRTLRASFNELGLLMFFLIIGVVLLSSAMYFAEINRDPPNPFSSIPATFWWTVITMTTVGYGDLVPTGVWGKLVGAICAVAAVLTIALPVPVIVSNFNYFYHRESDTAAANSESDDTMFIPECPFRPTCGLRRRSDPDYDQSEDEFGDIVRAEGMQIRLTASAVAATKKRFMAPLVLKKKKPNDAAAGPRARANSMSAPNITARTRRLSLST